MSCTKNRDSCLNNDKTACAALVQGDSQCLQNIQCSDWDTLCSNETNLCSQKPDRCVDDTSSGSTASSEDGGSVGYIILAICLVIIVMVLFWLFTRRSNKDISESGGTNYNYSSESIYGGL
jgi:ATP-dependent Zn protease